MMIKAGSEEEEEFLVNIIHHMQGVQSGELHSAGDVEARVQAMAEAIAKAWDDHATEAVITRRSRPWWNDECSELLDQFRTSRDDLDWRLFRSATKAAKRDFFDERIKEVAETNKRPWDLMEWVKQRKLPPCEAIRYNNQPCNELSDLWDALHGTYNAASGRAFDMSILDELPDAPERDWVDFAAVGVILMSLRDLSTKK
jgi:hypothetical protein